MNATIKVNPREITPNLTCKLCNGYFIDATTIIECLHSFCKSCIVKHLEQSEYCPICDVQLHTSKPLSSIRSDQMLQEVVYKLVPGLFQNEMQRRRKFYHENIESKPVSQVDSGLVYNESYISSEDIIHLSLEYYTNDAEFRKSTKRFYTCPAAVSISILKKLIQAKYDLSNEARIEVMYGQRILPDDFLLMDITYKYSWTQNGKPLQLCYHVKGPSGAFKPLVTSNAVENLLSTDSTKIKSIENMTVPHSKRVMKKHNRQSRAAGTNTSPFINKNGLGITVTPTRPLVVTNGIMNTSRESQTPLPTTNLDTAITPITPKSRKKKKAALVEANNQTDLVDSPSNQHVQPSKLKSKIKSFRQNKDGTRVETKEKEVQLRISENGVISARNVASGEEKIILGTNNNVNGPTSLTSSPILSSTTIISPVSAALAASPIVNVHIPTTPTPTVNSNKNGIVSNHLMTPGTRIMNNNSVVNKCSNANLNVNATMLPNLKQQEQMNVAVESNFKSRKQKNAKPLSLSRKRFQNIHAPGGAASATTINKAIVSGGKNLGNKVVKVSKRKLVNSNGPMGNGNKGNANTNNMATLKAVTKRLREELETKGVNYFSAEITPINGTPPPTLLKSIPEGGQQFPSATVCNVMSNPHANLNKRPHQTSTIINGEVKFSSTSTPTKKLLSSPNTKMFPNNSNSSFHKSSPTSNDRQKNHSPSVSPKKPPKFFKSRHSTADVSTTATPTTMGSSSDNNLLLNDSSTIGPTNAHFGVGTNNYCVSNAIANGSSHVHNSNNSKKVKLNCPSNLSTEQHNYIAASIAAAANTVMSTSAVLTASTPTMSIPSSQSVVNTNVTTVGQPGLRYPLHMPMNLVPFVTSNYCSMPFLNNLKNINIPSLPFGNPYLDYATVAQLQSLSQSLPNNGNVISTISNSNGDGNSSLDLSVSKINQFPTTNGTTTIIVPHPTQTSSHLQNLQNLHPQATNTTIMLNSNNFANARVVNLKTTTTASSNDQFVQVASTKQVPSLVNSSVVGSVSNSNSLPESITSTSVHSPSTKLNQVDTMNKNNNLHANSKSPSGNMSTGIQFEPPSIISNSLVAAQNLMKGIHNLGLGVNLNNVVTKNPRKSQSPAKLGRANSNNNNKKQQLSSTPEKEVKCKSVPVTTTTISTSSCCAGSKDVSTTVATEKLEMNSNLQQGNENVNDFSNLIPTSESLSTPSNLNSSLNGNTSVTVDLDKTNSVSIESEQTESNNVNESGDNDKPHLTTNGMEILHSKDDNVSSSGSDEFAMQIDETPLPMDDNVENTEDSLAHNDTHDAYDNNNVAKDSTPVANNNNNNDVSQHESSSTTMTTTTTSA